MHVELGYSIAPECLSPGECDEITKALAPIPRSRAGARHLMGDPIVAALANDRRLVSIARQWLGETAIPFRATLFEKAGEKNWLIAWHQDTALPLAAKFDGAGWGPWSVKGGVDYAHASASALKRVIALRVHLDESREENGPLRVISGSHKWGVLRDEEVLSLVSSTESVDCLSRRGDSDAAAADSRLIEGTKRCT